MNYMKLLSLAFECLQVSYYVYFYAIGQGNKKASELPQWVVNMLLIRVSPGGSGVLEFYFIAGLMGSLTAMLIVSAQYTQDCRDYAIKTYAENDSVGARE